MTSPEVDPKSVHENKMGKEASIKEVCKNFGFFDPLPPCPNFALAYSIEFTQPPLLHLLLAQPLSPLSVDVICTSPLSKDVDLLTS